MATQGRTPLSMTAFYKAARHGAQSWRRTRFSLSSSLWVLGPEKTLRLSRPSYQSSNANRALIAHCSSFLAQKRRMAYNLLSMRLYIVALALFCDKTHIYWMVQIHIPSLLLYLRHIQQAFSQFPYPVFRQNSTWS